MDKLAGAVPSAGRIDLAREPDFALGDLRVRPSRREIAGGGARHELQPRVMQVLVALARSPNEVVSQQELISRCWGGLAVGEDAIGRCIGQLRRLTATWPEPAFAIETIPGVGYRIDPRAIEAEPEVRASVRRRRLPWPAVGLVGAGAVVLAGLAIWWFAGPAGEASRPVAFPTVAVTPFEPADDTPTGKAFAAGMSVKVADAASHYNLVVIRPAQDGTRANPPTGADFLVGGRIIWKGVERTITSDLVDARRGIVVYSFDTSAPASPKIGAADEIAGRIAHALDPSKLTNDLAGKLSPTDYTLVARANDSIDRWDTVDALSQVRALAQRHLDDGDLQASTAIAALYAAQEARPADRPELVRLARRSVANAERLTSSSGLLCIARQMLIAGPLTYAAQERELRRAAQLDPNLHVAFNALGELLLSVGRTREGVGLITRSIQLDPMSAVVVTSGIRDFVEAGAADEAHDALQREETLWPTDAETARYFRYLIALYLGAPKDVMAIVAEKSQPIHHSVSPAQREAMVGVLKASSPDAIRRMVAECFANYGRSGDQVADQECLVEMVETGALDDAFRFAALAYPDHRNLYPPGADGWLIHPPLGLDPTWLFTPRMKAFRDDPRFWDVALRTGLVAYWRSTGAWPDMCQDQIALCQSRVATAQARDRAAGRKVS
jgi:DNA-binding winged helix-turn-helix (wHTH) protein/TolB-like protein